MGLFAPIMGLEESTSLRCNPRPGVGQSSCAISAPTFMGERTRFFFSRSLWNCKVRYKFKPEMYDNHESGIGNGDIQLLVNII